MFDPNKIGEIAKVSKAEKWSFPKVFDALKDAGVVNFETKVSNHQITYFGPGESCAETAPEGFGLLKIDETFSQQNISKIFEKIQKQEWSFNDFLKEMASAGANRYHVDVIERTITYLSRKGESFTEKIPG